MGPKQADLLQAALAEAENVALQENNYLGEDFVTEDYDDKLDKSASAKIADRARKNTSVLASGVDFRKIMQLKEGHESRPIWVAPTGQIYLEASSPYFALATDFLVAIAEPESRPELIHHYKLTPYSLYAAVSVNLDTETILRTLERLSKVPIPPEVDTFVRRCTASHGKAKLVLKRNRLYVESPYPEVLKKLLEIRAIRQAQDQSIDARLRRLEARRMGQDAEGVGPGQSANSVVQSNDVRLLESAAVQEDRAAQATDFEELDKLLERRIENIDDIADDDEEDGGVGANDATAMAANDGGGSGKKRSAAEAGMKDVKSEPSAQRKVLSFEIRPEYIEQVKEAAMMADYPLMEEYDFKRDSRNPDLPINLRASTRVRAYQEKSLAKMFGNGRARSGIIVLPCGAGKTLTGITAACTVKKSCIIFCINSVGVEQWIRSIKMFTTLKDEHIRRFTSLSKDDLHESGATVLVTTYNMMSYSKGRSADGERVMQQVKNTEWGLIIMDEVHVVPAKMFRMALRHVKSHCKLGLTATLVREDGLIDDLNFLIGPKLYEANWQALTEQGFLAKVLCAEVWCPMTPEFFEEYLRPDTPAKRKQLLYVMNPNKFAICQMLLRYHVEKKDKVLVFSDDIPAILRYSTYLRIHHLYGDTTQWERERLLRRFRGGKNMLEGEKEINVLVISQVGDVGIDLPQANVIIQVSSHFGSRRQEAQRLGRILRPKPGEDFNVGWNAFFYTLISMDTSEMYFSNKRQQYLVDQGYTFKVIRNIKEIARASGIPYEELPIEKQREIQRDLRANKVSEALFEKSLEIANRQAAAKSRKAAAGRIAPTNKLMRSVLRKTGRLK
ncbi:TFIIH basal transcription factor complex helicase XPB subunit [Hondaea fermentalgiana]|uniref:DNA 3'-5' helicase n=1 Tax=Hondaea fermentalgiana TaxID=2315210 RepID=A0A2R5GY32_9STRA|nr:TFIIH basal transcription factor complex helicase XPB subunit [Hondaea fermentalgiana]|eukprot:GBG33351.1 TFIIH basal transcription factor complex helicase XPB subunit [Hondaea fermentalgiana]